MTTKIDEKNRFFIFKSKSNQIDSNENSTFSSRQSNGYGNQKFFSFSSSARDERTSHLLFSRSTKKEEEKEKETNPVEMATSTTVPTGASVTRVGRPINSGSGTVAPLNTPTRRFYPSQDHLDLHEPGIPNPNVYVVQPFKQSSLPKDLVYSKKNPPNPGEELLNSTIDLINHFTSCYETVKHQLQDEHTKSRESALISRTVTFDDRHYPNSRISFQRPTKQAPLRPLRVHPTSTHQREPSIERCLGILPIPTTKANDLNDIYQEKLRLLRQSKPEFFDAHGNLLSSSAPRNHSVGQASAPSSKKSATSSFRTPHNTVLSVDNTHFDDRRTFLTEFTNEDEDNENENEHEDEDEKKRTQLINNQQPNSVNEFMNKNYVIKVLEIKTIKSSSSKRDRTKSGSDYSHTFNRRQASTAKSS